MRFSIDFTIRQGKRTSSYFSYPSVKSGTIECRDIVSEKLAQCVSLSRAALKDADKVLDDVVLTTYDNVPVWDLVVPAVCKTVA